MNFTLVTGCMYSGKTSLLIDRKDAYEKAGQTVLVIKPQVDVRYDAEKICSHDGSGRKALSVRSSKSIIPLVVNADRVIIDEVQFMDSGIVDVIKILCSREIDVLAAGLDRDWKGEFFPTIIQLKALHPEEIQLTSSCEICGQSANRTQRLVNSPERVLIGAEGMYAPRCETHHTAELKSFSAHA